MEILKVRHRAHCPICGKTHFVTSVDSAALKVGEFDAREAVVNPLARPVECCNLAWYGIDKKFLGKNWLIMGVNVNEQVLSF